MPGNDKKSPSGQGQGQGNIKGLKQQRSLGAKISDNGGPFKGAFVKVQKGDTMCGLAHAFLGEGTPCKLLREHDYNGNVREPLVPGSTVFIPGLQAADDKPPEPKLPRPKVGVELRWGRPTKGPTISTLPPAEYMPPARPPAGDLDIVWAEVQDELPASKKFDRRPVTFGILSPEVTADPDGGTPYIDFLGGGGKTLDLPVENDKTRPFRLVVYENDRRANPDSLLVQELPRTVPKPKTKYGPETRLKAEILGGMKVRATYKLPACKGAVYKKANNEVRQCKVVAEATLDPGRPVKLAVRVIRPDRIGGTTEVPLPVTDKASANLVKTNVTWLEPARVQDAVIGMTRRIWAQARIAPTLVRLELCAPPSDMLAVADWDGLTHDPAWSHLPENGKSAAADHTLEFEVRWARREPSDVAAVELHKARLKVDIAKGKTPAETAAEIARAINAEFLDNQHPAFAAVSPNPRQTNAKQASCDVLLTPPSGYMLIEELKGGTADVDQKVHRIRFDAANVVISNFPESYHIGSPHHRQLMKTMPRGDADVKVAIVADSKNVLRGSGTTAIAFGLGRQSDFDAQSPDQRWMPSEELRDTILGTEEMIVSPVLLAHELGHVLIDTAGHTDVVSQLMWHNPLEVKEPRLRGLLPSVPDWQTPVRDAVRSALNFRAMWRSPVDVVGRVHGVKAATGPAVDLDTPRESFRPLQPAELAAITGGVQSLLDFALGQDSFEATKFTLEQNYLPRRNDLMNAWYQYKDVEFADGYAEGREKLEKVRSALRGALHLGSDAIRAVIQGGQQRGDVDKLLTDPFEEKDYVKLRDDLLPRLGAVLGHEDFVDGFLEACPACAALGPGGLLVGFTGVHGDPKLAVDKRTAIFVTYERFGLPGSAHRSGRQKQPGITQTQHYYTALHEALHLHSCNARGFQSKIQNPPRGVGGDWKGVLDEGTTELFTRIIYYHGRAKKKFPGDSPPSLTYFGLAPDRFIPAYEVVKNVVAEMAADVGVKQLAQAYFKGKFSELFLALDAKNPKYGELFWSTLSRLSINPEAYMADAADSSVANDLLRDGGKVKTDYPGGLKRCLRTADIFKWTFEGKLTDYEARDPAFEIYEAIANDLK